MSRAAAALLLVLAGVAAAQAQGADALRAGNAAFDAGRLDAAEARYRDAARDGETAPTAWFNLGVLMARRGQDALAARTFAGAAERATADVDKARAQYNRGVVLARAGHLEEALGAFREALRRDPTSEPARTNFAIVRARLERDARNRARPQPNPSDETRQALEQVPAQSFEFTRGTRRTQPVRSGHDW